MLQIKSEGIILEKTELPFENEAVLNPSCIEVGGVVHMYYRAVNRDKVSSVGYCQLKENKVTNRFPYPILKPEHEYEKQGIEDPRIVQLDGLYYLFYTAYDGRSAIIAYATSTDLINFDKKGPISPRITYQEVKSIIQQSRFKEKYNLFADKFLERMGKDVLLWDKDAFIFPKRINDRIALIHRILPEIQIVYFNDFKDLTVEYWKEYLMNLDKHIVLNAKFWFENRNVGGGCPPIETKDGWLFIYHGVENTMEGKKRYHASAALLDLNNPTKVISRLEQPLFSPEESWEKNGVVSDVVFPTGAIIQNKQLYIYYGAADKLIAAKSIELEALLNELTVPILDKNLKKVIPD